MKATLIVRDRVVFEDGYRAEVVIWSVPIPVPPSDHKLKYRLFYGRPGERIVAYDNERGKGDHRHLRGREEPYRFSVLPRPLDDFHADVAKVRGETI